jgi:hypothetical protein
MNALFDYGYRRARNGDPWKAMPPFMESRGSR